jgi:hypothetical protein
MQPLPACNCSSTQLQPSLQIIHTGSSFTSASGPCQCDKGEAAHMVPAVPVTHEPFDQQRKMPSTLLLAGSLSTKVHATPRPLRTGPVVQTS